MSDGDRDRLTGLWSRTGVLELLREELPARAAAAPAAPGWASIALLDLDQFKRVNDEHGHQVGDEVIVEVARRLEACAGGQAVVARWGGDEFVVLSKHPPEACSALFDLLQEELLAGVQAGEMRLPVTVSGGSTWLDPEDLDGSLRDADHAMFQAKSRGGMCLVVHGPQTARYVEERRELLDRMARMQAEITRLVDEAHTDPLTGIGNRRALDGHVEALDRRGLPAPLRRAVLFVDLDRFHGLNRAQGDAAGDEALRRVAATLASTCRDTDVLVPQERPAAFRKGGEEFVVVAPVRDEAGALALAERLCTSVRDLGIAHGEPGQPVLTATIGVAVTTDEHDVGSALRRAGVAMGRLKNSGRRGVVGLVGEHDQTGPDEKPHETLLG